MVLATAHAVLLASPVSEAQTAPPGPLNTESHPATPPVSAPPAATAPAPIPALVDPTAPNNQSLGFLSRFLDAYVNGYGRNEPTPSRRALPDALDSPPFPDPRWSLNGTPDIGIPDTTVYPFMAAVYGSGKAGKVIKDSRVKLLGWVDTTWNVSTSTAYNGNYPSAYQINPNTVTLQQIVLRLERQPDTFQKGHFDWGFDVDFLYGQDFRWTEMNGIFSNQLKNNNEYGYDINQFYVDAYLPWLAEGLDIRIGRFISIPDIEANLTVDQPFSSHSLTYTYDPFSQMGLVANLKLNLNMWVQLGLVAGDDNAIWEKHTEPTLVGCFRWESTDQRDSIYPCINSLNDGKYFAFTDGPTPSSSPIAYPSNNLQAFVTTWGHRFSKEWTMQTEVWFMYMLNAPSYTNGAPTGKLVAFNYEWTILNFQFWQFSPVDFIGLRNELMADVDGQRTGYNTRYWETTVSWNHWLANGAVGLRPEIRYDMALDHNQTPFDGGTRNKQLWAQMDLVVRF